MPRSPRFKYITSEGRRKYQQVVQAHPAHCSNCPFALALLETLPEPTVASSPEPQEASPPATDSDNDQDDSEPPTTPPEISEPPSTPPNPFEAVLATLSDAPHIPFTNAGVRRLIGKKDLIYAEDFNLEVIQRELKEWEDLYSCSKTLKVRSIFMTGQLYCMLERQDPSAYAQLVSPTSSQKSKVYQHMAFFRLATAYPRFRKINFSFRRIRSGLSGLKQYMDNLPSENTPSYLSRSFWSE